MKHLTKIVILGILVSMGCLVMAQKSLTVTAKFPGSAVKWVHAAEPEFQKKNINIEFYNVTITEKNETAIVSLQSLDAKPGARGSSGSHPGFEVEINKADSKVLRANFVR